LNLKGDPLRLDYTSTLTDTNNVYGDNVGKKVVDEKSQEKKLQEKSHRKTNERTPGDHRCNFFYIILRQIDKKT
jgi:hypothetical protein